MVGPYSPTSDPNTWLQTFDGIQLTLRGRDRARCRVIQGEPPDPGEDEGRIITGLTMEEIARSIGNTYTASQLPRYLRESGIPSEEVPDEVSGSRWEYVATIFDHLHEGGSASRRALRQFIDGWLDGRYHTPPPAKTRKRIVALLEQQGWHVYDGRLVIGDRVFVEAGSVAPLDGDARIAALHPDIQAVTERFVDEHLDVAIFEAFKSVGNRIKKMTELDLDGASLIDRTMGSNNPMIVFGDLATQTGRDVQQGMHFLFNGAVQGIRNEDAHEQFQLQDETAGLEELVFAGMLMRRLDAATLRQKM